MSQQYDFLAPDEADAIRVLQEYITTRTQESKKRAVQILSKYITMGYYLGAEKAIKTLNLPIKPTSIGVKGLTQVVDELSPILDETFGALSGGLTGAIEEGIRNDRTYAQIRQGLKEKLSTFGDSIPFKNAGKTREYVEVLPDGTMKLAQKVITRNVNISTDVYADMLSRTATKKAYAIGHIEGYKHAGMSKWRYSSVADERTRPRHLALHGKILEVGSQDEALALRVMSEPNCRCRPVPFFDDAEMDTPKENFDRERERWSRQAYEEWKLDKNISFISGANPQSKADLQRLKPELEKRMNSNDYRILGHNIRMKPADMADDVIKTLDENFSYKIRDKEFAFTHIYNKHSTQEGFNLTDVLRIRGTGDKIGLWRGSLQKIGQLADGRTLRVAISEKTYKINTAHVTNKKYLRKVKDEAKKVEYDYTAG